MQTNDHGYLISEGEWWLRLVFAILCAAIAYSVVILALLIIEPFWGFMIGTSLWVIGVGYAFPLFSVAVPEATGLLTINQLKRATEEDNFANQRVFMVGLSPRFPWERKTSFIDLRQVQIKFIEDVSPKDGVLVNFRGSIIYNPRPDWLPVYIAVSKETIEESLKDVATSYLTREVANEETAEGTRHKAHNYEIGLKVHFERVAEEQSFEKQFGIDVSMVRMADVGFNPQYTEALNNRAIAKTVGDSADEIKKKSRDLTDKDAMNTALVISGKASKQIIEFEGTPQIVDGIVRAVSLFANRSEAR